MVFRVTDGGGHSILLRMREADVDVAQADYLRPCFGATVEIDERLAPPIRDYLNVSPGDTANAGPQRLHDGLLRGEAGRKLAQTPTAEGDFQGCKDAMKKALAVPLKNRFYAMELDYIDADSGAAHSRFILARTACTPRLRAGS